MKLVIFDCDGTLVDSQNGIVEAMGYAFAQVGLPAPERQAVLSIVGLSLPQAFAVLAREHDARTQAALVDGYRNAFTHMRRDPAHHEPLYPGIREIIATLAARTDIVLGVATGKSRRGVTRLFDREDWHDHFLTIQTADDNPSKPHPSMILRAIGDAGALPRSTVMIGDTAFDMEMARHADVGAIGVAWGYHNRARLLQGGAHTISDRQDDLLAQIDAQLAAQEAGA
jgi:phosphoglycolate phosphatase